MDFDTPTIHRRDNEQQEDVRKCHLEMTPSIGENNAKDDGTYRECLFLLFLRTAQAAVFGKHVLQGNGFEKVVVFPFSNDMAITQDIYHFGIAHGSELVGDDNESAVFGLFQ